MGTAATEGTMEAVIHLDIYIIVCLYPGYFSFIARVEPSGPGPYQARELIWYGPPWQLQEGRIRPPSWFDTAAKATAGGPDRPACRHAMALALHLQAELKIQ